MSAASSRLGAWALTGAVGIAVLSALAHPRGWDDFPISSFPMFSRGDLGHEVALTHAVLVDRDERRRPAPPRYVGTPEPMIAQSILAGGVAAGDAGGLCARIAKAAALRQDRAVKVEIFTTTFDTQAYFREGRERSVRGSTLHVSCEVGP